MKRLIYILLFSLTISRSFAQSLEVGGEIGYGSTYINDNIVFKEFFGSNALTNITGGVNIAFNPKKTIVFINSGIIYILKGNNNYSFNNIRVPLGIKIEPGRRGKFIIGGGIYLNYLFKPSGNVSPDFLDTKREFQFGGYFNTGAKYQFLEHWNVFLVVQINFDLSTLYFDVNPHHDGTHTNSPIHSYDVCCRIGCSYSIPIRNGKK